ncbi:MAG: PHP domain-containing protein [Candidatus Aenigmarchaeota archaeon]|nr:PHP domain-containing protein [Candidatus Aenigmarchaeota archaeon]
MELKLDLHIHTKYSNDGFMGIPELIKQAKKRGLSGIAITDHDTCKGLDEALKIGKKEKFLIIPGIEIKSKHGDILGLGITTPVKRGMSAKETVSKIHELSGMAIAAHPYSLVFHPSGVGGKVKTAGFDAIEIFNSRTYYSNKIAEQTAEKYGLSKVASSDSHLIGEIGNSYTIVNCKPDIKSVLNEIKNGRTKTVGRLTPLKSIMNWYYLRLKRSL